MIPIHENFILLAALSINYLEGLNISALHCADFQKSLVNPFILLSSKDKQHLSTQLTIALKEKMKAGLKRDQV